MTTHPVFHELQKYLGGAIISL